MWRSQLPVPKADTQAASKQWRDPCLQLSTTEHQDSSERLKHHQGAVAEMPSIYGWAAAVDGAGRSAQLCGIQSDAAITI